MVFTFELCFTSSFLLSFPPSHLEHHRAAGQGRGRHGQDQRRDEGGRETHHRDGEMVRPLRHAMEQVTNFNAFRSVDLGVNSIKRVAIHTFAEEELRLETSSKGIKALSFFLLVHCINVLK